MAERTRVNVWYDKEGDYLDVTWGRGNTYYTATEDEHVMALVDMEGNIQGFKIDGLSTIRGTPLDVDLTPSEPKNMSQEIKQWGQEGKKRAKKRS
jgi:hypothetical protein